MHRLLFVAALYQLVAGETSPNICTTPGCLYFADSIKNNGNTTVDPCEDFYEFTCGRWSENNPIPSDQEQWGTPNIMAEDLLGKLIDLFEDDSDPSSTTVAFQKIQKMYRNCMDLEAIERNGVEAILSRLRITGGWPVMMALDNWISNTISLTQIHGYYTRELGLKPLYTVSPSSDPLNSTVNQLYIDVTSRTPFRSILKNHARNSSEVVQYVDEIIKVVNILGNETGSIVSIVDVQKDVNDLVDFEQSLVKLISANRHTEPKNLFITVNDLQTWYSNISRSENSKIIWIDLLQSIFRDTGILLTEDSTVILRSETFPALLVKLLDNTPMRTIINYIQWVFIDEVMLAAPKKLRNVSFELGQLEDGGQTPEERNVTCTDLLKYEDAVGHEFVKHHFSSDKKFKVNETITKISEAFNRIVHQTLWLKPNEQQFVYEKLSTMVRLIGYPEWYDDPENIEAYYQECNIDGSFLDNMIEMRRFHYNKNLQKLTEINERTKFSQAPTETNAGYSRFHNSIQFTAAILRKPIFSNDVPSVLQYAVFGAIAGHEISHAFDPEGAQFDKNGNPFDWWSNETKDTYESKVDCIVKQYDNYTIYADGNTTIKANGDPSKRENIADLHGLKSAYKAYENNKTPEDENLRLPGLESYNDQQLFFLAYATFQCSSQTQNYLMNYAKNSVHPISRLRVIGSFSNMKEFSAAFKCPDTAKMNRQDKCVIWGSAN